MLDHIIYASRSSLFFNYADLSALVLKLFWK